MRKGDFDYAASVGSYFHLAGVISHIISKAEKGDTGKALIIIRPNIWGYSYNFDEEYSFKGYSIKITNGNLDINNVVKFVNLCKKLLSYTFFINKKVYFAGPNLPRLSLISQLKPGKKIEGVSVLEGLGMYVSFSQLYKKEIFETKNIFFRYYPWLLNIKNKFKRSIYVDINWNPIEVNVKEGYIFDNKLVSSFYRKAFRWLDEDYIINSKKNDGESVDVVYLTQPCGAKTRNTFEEQICMVNLAKKIAGERGLSFYIKKHPGDDIEWEGRGYNVIGKGVGAEAVFAKWHPEMVFGKHSTSLVTAKLIFGIESFSLLNFNSFCFKWDSDFSLGSEAVNVFFAFVKDATKEFELPSAR